MKLSIIIPTKDRAAILQRTIDNLTEAVEELNTEIIIVNDSQTPIKLNNNNSNIHILNNSGSGAASARNVGVKQSQGELLLFLDDDILVNKANILKTLSLHKEKKKVAFNFFWIYPPDLIETLPNSSFGRYILKYFLFTNSHRIKINGKINEFVKPQGLTSQYFSILKTDFIVTGGYNEEIPFAGFEDSILYKELKKNGIEIFISPTDIIFQNETDRIFLFSVMERYRRGAITIRKAQKMGHQEAKITFPKVKKTLYSILVHFKPFIYKMTMKIPNNKLFDFIYFKSTNLLLGLSLYEGHHISK